MRAGSYFKHLFAILFYRLGLLVQFSVKDASFIYQIAEPLFARNSEN